MTFRTAKTATMMLILSCLLAACSGGGSGSSSPPAGSSNTHAANYLLHHAADASANLNSCRDCHGTDFSGVGNAGSCLECHRTASPFVVHISAYADPAQHGAAARASQIECLGCHGMSPNVFDGGILSDPNLFNIPDANCSTQNCHPAATAHPTNWQGDVDDIDPGYASSHRTINAQTMNESCAICHNVTGPGAGPKANAPSCFAANHTNSNGISTGCHPGGP